MGLDVFSGDDGGNEVAHAARGGDVNARQR